MAVRRLTVRSVRPSVPENPVVDTVPGAIPPYRSFPKTGKSWGSPPRLSADEWIAVFSYSEDAGPSGKIFVDLYDQRLGFKLLSTSLPVTVAPNDLFRGAVWIEDGYILLPLDLSRESFAFWRLP